MLNAKYVYLCREEGPHETEGYHICQFSLPYLSVLTQKNEKTFTYYTGLASLQFSSGGKLFLSISVVDVLFLCNLCLYSNAGLFSPQIQPDQRGAVYGKESSSA